MHLKDTLHHVASLGLIEIAELLIQHGALIEEKTWIGLTPLHFAIQHNQKEMVEFLIKKGASINSRYHYGPDYSLYYSQLNKFKVHLSPLLRASHFGHMNIIEILLRHGADFLEKDRNGYTILHHAVHEHVIDFFIRKGLDIEARNRFSQTPLHVASNYGNLEAIKALIKNGAKVEVEDRLGRTPLDYAVKYGQEYVKVLMDSGAEIKEDIYESTLYHATTGASLTSVQYLIEHCGANVNNEWNGFNLLNGALNCSHLGFDDDWKEAERQNIAFYLIEKGADYRNNIYHQTSLLTHAAINDFVELGKFLICNGVYIDEQDDFGNTALHTAIDNSSYRVAKMLIQCGASLSLRNFNQQLTPFELCLDDDTNFRIDKAILVMYHLHQM